MTIKSLMSELKDVVGQNITIDEVLDVIGLQPKRNSTSFLLPAIGIFAAGLVVGGVLSVLFTPLSGEELRGQIRGKIDKVKDQVAHANERSRSGYAPGTNI